MSRDHHEGFGIPSNARYRMHARPFTEYDRRDPGYDDHRPLERADWGELLRAIPVAILGLIALGAFCALAIAVLGPVPA